MIPVVVVPTKFEDLLQCASINTFYLIKRETELFLVTIPFLLAFTAVAVVSVRLSSEIQPQVNLPTENIIPTHLREPQCNHPNQPKPLYLESFNEVPNCPSSNDIPLAEKSPRPTWDNVQIRDVKEEE